MVGLHAGHRRAIFLAHIESEYCNPVSSVGLNSQHSFPESHCKLQCWCCNDVKGSNQSFTDFIRYIVSPSCSCSLLYTHGGGHWRSLLSSGRRVKHFCAQSSAVWSFVFDKRTLSFQNCAHSSSFCVRTTEKNSNAELQHSWTNTKQLRLPMEPPSGLRRSYSGLSSSRHSGVKQIAHSKDVWSK